HYHGELVGRRRRYNERLVMFILRNRAPERYAEGGSRGLSAIDTMKLKRLKAAWRAEWDEEHRPRPLDEVRDSILRKLSAIDAAERERWTPREHELHAALDEERARRRAREKQAARERFA